MTSGIKVLPTPIRGLVCSVPPLQHKICVLQATTECCGSRLRVSLLCTEYISVGASYSTCDTEQLTNLLKIPQCHSTGAMIDQVAHREQRQGVKELEDGIAWLVD